MEKALEIPMRRSNLFLAAVAFSLSSTLSIAASARDQIRIVGSSTVFPFATAVAEEFGRTTSFKTPIIESTGSGGGLKLFCAGVGVEHPDVANASRRIEQSEIDLCAENSVTEITEVKIGYDGIVLANSKRAGKCALTLRQVFLALAKEIPAPNGDLVAKNLERVGDHATNIAESVILISEARNVKHAEKLGA
jgi:phosphate transport system substrate-binding protein